MVTAIAALRIWGEHRRDGLTHGELSVVRVRPRVPDERTAAPLDSLLLPRDSVRVVRRIARPDRIPAGQRWIHVDLSEQSLAGPT